MTHICVGKLTIIGSDNGLSPGRRRAIIWTNAGILLIWPLGTNFNGISFGNQTFSFKKMHLKMSSAKWCPFSLGLKVLRPERTSSCKWKRFPYHWPFVSGISRSPLDSPHKRSVIRRSCKLSLNKYVNKQSSYGGLGTPCTVCLC